MHKDVLYYGPHGNLMISTVISQITGEILVLLLLFVVIFHVISGVELVVESNVLSVKQEMMYTAIVRPNNPGIVTSYLWTFKSPTKSQGRGSYGGIKKYRNSLKVWPRKFSS